MLLTIAIISICLALISIVFMFLIRQNIVNILDKDLILFDKNFELKKQAIETAMKLVDNLSDYGPGIASKPEFVNAAKSCYNQLLCVASNLKLANEFHKIVLENVGNLSAEGALEFKLLCRKDIGLTTKKLKTNQNNND